MAKSKRQPPTFPKKKIQDYFELEAQRLRMVRDLGRIKKQQDAIEDGLAKFTRHAGGSASQCGFILYFKQRRKNVAWKEEFISLRGREHAEQVIADQPTIEVLVIEKTA